MLHLASFGFLEGTALIAVIGAIAAGFVAIRKLGPEKDALYITTAQGAAVISNSLIDTLRQEVDRCRARMALLEAEVERLDGENEELKAEMSGLRRRHGERRGDQPSP